MTGYKANKMMIAAESTYPQPNAEQSVALEADAATLARRYVRITGHSANGFITFEFSVGWPDMSVTSGGVSALVMLAFLSSSST